MFGLTNSQLRHWEKEFKQIHPQKNRHANRMYTSEDIETVRKIYVLLKEKGYTIEGARKHLSESTETPVIQTSTFENKEKVLSKLMDIKKGLLSIQSKLEKI